MTYAEEYEMILRYMKKYLKKLETSEAAEVLTILTSDEFDKLVEKKLEPGRNVKVYDWHGNGHSNINQGDLVGVFRLVKFITKQAQDFERWHVVNDLGGCYEYSVRARDVIL